MLSACLLKIGGVITFTDYNDITGTVDFTVDASLASLSMLSMAHPESHADNITIS